MAPRFWLDSTFLGPAEDLLELLALREEGSGAIEAAAVTEKGPAEAPVKITIKCLEAWDWRGPCAWQMVNHHHKH